MQRDAGADQWSQWYAQLLGAIDERHAQHERAYNDRFTRVETAQVELVRRLTVVRLLSCAAGPALVYATPAAEASMPWLTIVLHASVENRRRRRLKPRWMDTSGMQQRAVH